MPPGRRSPNPLRIAELATERAIITKIRSGTPLLQAPPSVRSLIVRYISCDFGRKRFTFIQLLKHAPLIPELAWWATDPRTQDLLALTVPPRDDAGIYQPDRVIARTQDAAAEIAVHALRESGLWDTEIVTFETDNTEHIVFAPRPAPHRG